MMSLVEYASSDSDDDSHCGVLTSESDASTLHVSSVSNRPVDDGSMNVDHHQHQSSKDSKTVKITVPALSEFDDIDDEPSLKRCKVSTGNGLFSVLPPPKNTVITKIINRPLVPHSVAKQRSTTVTSSPSTSKVRRQLDDEAVLSSSVDASVDADDAGSADFFSLDNVSKDTRPSSNLTPTTCTSGEADSSDDPAISTTTAMVSTTEDSAPEDAPLQFDSAWVSSSNIDVEHASSSTDRHAYDAQSYYNADVSEGGSDSGILDEAALFNDEAFLRMVGKSRHKREDIQIVDVAQADQLPKYDEWLTKALTEDVDKKSTRKKGVMPTSQQRRKHQITYLAFQARERELELKNQWAENRQSRRQTQAKYGF